MLDKSKNRGVNHPYLRNINVRWFEFDLSDLLEMPFEMQEADRYSIKHGDLVICEGGEPGRCAVWDKSEPIMFQKALHRVRFFGEINSHFISIIIYLYCLNGFITKFFTGSGIKHLTGESLANIPIPMPPIKEQLRILKSVNLFDIIIQQITDNKKLLSNTIILIKSKILDLAMQGKLVPQDTADESAAEMLRRVNPEAKIITDTPHYPQLPDNWVLVPLEDITEYEQPQPYIVKDTSYSDIYTIPVLTAGKSFILGYTNEDFGVYENVPAIIFDDFTTDSRLVEFPFKVKSSAMKIIQVKRGLNIEYVAMFMSITRLIGETHKRYWISEYSKILLPVPPLEEQNRIVKRVSTIYCVLDKIISALTE